MVRTESIFKALADSTRQRALRVLLRHELSVTELVEVLGQPQSTVSRHLKVLRAAELIRDRREGATVVYAIRNDLDGRECDLASQLLDWIGRQPFEGVVKTRLEAVVNRRRVMSDEFFSRMGHGWDTLREESFGTRFHLEPFLALLPRHWVVADVGTGTGYLLPTLSRYFSKVVGIEPVEKMRSVAQHRIAGAQCPNVRLCGGDLERLPLDAESVDLVTAFLVLHHVPSPGDALVDMFRVVRPGGFVLIVEQEAHESSSFRERMQDRWWGFDPQVMKAEMVECGFSDVAVHSITNVERAADAPNLFVLCGHRLGGDGPFDIQVKN